MAHELRLSMTDHANGVDDQTLGLSDIRGRELYGDLELSTQDTLTGWSAEYRITVTSL